jgi:hypothetical protein
VKFFKLLALFLSADYTTAFSTVMQNYTWLFFSPLKLTSILECETLQLGILKEGLQ